MQIICPAKINLFLKVIGKDLKSGFHDLESVFAFLDIFDVLEVQKSDVFDLKISGEFAHFIDLKDNLFLRIIDFFSQNFATDNRLKINLQKNIPVGAGLGGGSSNACYFMLALNQIFNLSLSKNELQKISFNFGSDIAFFFEEHAGIVRGRGNFSEKIYEFQPLKILLINPKINLSTKEVFKNFDLASSKEIPNEEIKNKDIFELISMPNDLTKSASELCLEISEILSELKKLGAAAAKMSGSGATCFAVFEDDSRIKIAKEAMLKTFPNFLVRESFILPKPARR